MLLLIQVELKFTLFLRSKGLNSINFILIIINMKNNPVLSILKRSFCYSFLSFIPLFFFPLNGSGSNANADEAAIIGRWDLTVDMGGNAVPSWLEVKLSGVSTLVGYFVSDAGSARPISVVNFAEGKVTFSIPKQWETGDKDLVFEGTLLNDKLSGVITSPSGEKHSFTGERAPLLKRTKPPVWGNTITMFNGKNLDGWHAQKKDNQWVAENGVLKSPRPGSNLISDQKFEDFRMHVEFRIDADGNSGVYLRGRYELQIVDSKGKEPSSIYLGGIYGFLTPNENVDKGPGEWQAYDITFIGRRITIVANGKTIINDQIIPGITGGAIDSKEGEPGPIMLQGDHRPAEFRNITITPAK
jgi:hypothetical protein